MVENLEVEVKVLEKSYEDFQRYLYSLGAEKVLDEILETSRLDLDNRYEIGSDEVLRLRYDGSNLVLTHKKKSSCENSRLACVESEIQVLGSFSQALDFFKKLGYKEIDRNRKRRVSFLFPGGKYYLRFDFDKYLDDLDFIPEFLEIESNIYRRVLEGADYLSIQEKDFKYWGLSDLIEHYGK